MIKKHINPKTLLGTPIDNNDYLKLREQKFTEVVELRQEVEIRIHNTLDYYYTNQR